MYKYVYENLLYLEHSCSESRNLIGQFEGAIIHSRQERGFLHVENLTLARRAYMYVEARHQGHLLCSK